ncbi:MAG: SRPBCC domain-containing protein [Myxococcales bacterium]|nr:SRPBCC domain-containing protein [Myxococcales bacterium]
MSQAPLAGDEARVTVLVRVPPREAFRVFTEEIDAWWRRGRRYRIAKGRDGTIHLEPGVGGRLFESYRSAAGNDKVVQTGEVTVWEPPHRLVLRWRAVNFAPHEHTEVEVSFAESLSGTQVTVVHRGWSQIRPDHPARHGQAVGPFLRSMGLWWGDLMTSLRLRSSAAVDPGAPR